METKKANLEVEGGFNGLKQYSLDCPRTRESKQPLIDPFHSVRREPKPVNNKHKEKDRLVRPVTLILKGVSLPLK